MKHLMLVMISIFCTLSFTFAESTVSDTTRSIFDDFYQPDKVVEVTLQFDCKAFIRTKQKQEEHPATLTYQRPNGESVTQTIKVLSRGRLRLEICGFPPMKLDFDKKNLETQGFSTEMDEIKLVTHCYDNNRNDQLVIKEFLAYQLYNVIEKYSYRVQLLNVKYVDMDGKLYAENKAFMIEPTDAMAARLGCRESERHLQNESELNADTYANMLLFQYMIGNVDFDITSLHNVKLVKPLSTGWYIPVPYDFDFSGLVSAQYAAPQERVNQKYVGERILVGKFQSDASFQASLQRFLDARQQILDICNNFSYLDDKEKEKALKYLNAFFKRIEQKKMSPDKL
ncbi:MAG: hypothetical protein SFU99_18850 [Saprospiraceae bacterium]|nr:hypothetical protein [Saprospiraceae bacterium]